MAKTKIEQMYEDMISNVANEFDDEFGSLKYQYDEDDMEVIETSKEIAENQKKREEMLKDRGIQQNEYPIEESVHFKRYTTRRQHKYTESELKKIRESCESTIVHDYGEHDIYHMSDEERIKDDMLAELSVKLRSLKTIYGKVDQYIEAMRIVVQAWELLEKRNYIHSEKEFFELVAEGKIVSGRILMPKLRKASQYNQEVLIKYISNTELDPHDLVIEDNKDDEDFYEFIEDNEDYQYYYQEFINNYHEEREKLIHQLKEAGREDEIEEVDEWELNYRADEYARDQLELEDMTRLLSAEEAQYLVDNMDNPNTMYVEQMKPKFIKGYDNNNFSRLKKRKYGSKTNKYIAANLHEILNKIQNNPSNVGEEVSRSYVITHSMFDPEKREKDFWDDMFFDGSLADENANILYDLAVREKILNTQHPPKDRYYTYGDKELTKFFNVLEKSGVNTLTLSRNMNYSGGDEEYNKTVAEKQTKENRKIESSIVQRLIGLNGNDKFKKIVSKVENALNEQAETH